MNESSVNEHQPQIAVIGAGMSGIAVGYYLKQAGIGSFTIFERSDAAGGTWHLHNYPGLCCDVPSHLYSYSFEPNPDWSHIFSPRAEIEAYFQRTAKKHGIEPHIRFNTEVRAATWTDDHWDLELANGERHAFRFIISAIGGLFEPQYPDIPGVHAFKGASWHSVHWNDEYDLSGKTVVVVGSAASAVQIVPQIAPKVKQLYLLQRTPNWIVPRRDRAYPEWLKALFRRFPLIRELHRKQIERLSLRVLSAFHNDQNALDMLMRMGRENIEKSIADPAMREALTPSYLPGCKRLLVSDDFYPALARENVELVTEAAARVIPDGLVTAGGRELKADVIIYCTGYKLPAFHLPVHVTGRDGNTLGDYFDESPFVYRGVALPGFPNYFMINGPNGPLGYTSVIISSEFQAQYIAKLILETERSGTQAIEIKDEVNRAYNQALQKELKQMTWGTECPSYYRDQEGNVIVFFPGDEKRMKREYEAAGLNDYERIA